MSPGRRRFVSTATVIGIALTLVGAGSAAGHSTLAWSTPPDGAVLNQPPATLELGFSEAIEPTLSSFELVAGDERLIGLDVRIDPARRTTVVLTPPRLPPDAYRLRWRVVSNDDFHASNGQVVFGIERPIPAGPPQAAASAPDPLDVAFRSGNLVGLSGLIGLLALALLALPRTELRDRPSDRRSRARRRLVRLGVISGVLSIVAAVGRLLVEAGGAGAAIGPAELPQLIVRTSYGWRWFVEQALVVATLSLLIAGERHPSVSSRASVALGVMLVGVTLVHGASGHLAVVAGPIGAIVSGVHLLAASVWVGGLAGLTIAILPLARGDNGDRALAGVVLRRFGLVAAPSVATLVASGLFASGQLVATPDALLVSDYGHALLAKVAIGVGIALAGLRNATVLHRSLRRVATSLFGLPAGGILRRLARIDLGRSVRLEAGMALALIVVAAGLSATPPARGPAFDSQSEPTLTPTISQTADDLLISLSVKPNHPGRNIVSVGVSDTRRPAPAPIERVLLRASSPAGERIEGVVTPLGKGRFEIVTDAIQVAGGWQFDVITTRPSLSDSTLRVSWAVSPKIAARIPIIVSDRPLAPVLTWLAIAVAVGLFATALGWAAVRHRKSGTRLPASNPGASNLIPESAP